MNKWLIIHSIESYSQHMDMIGCKFMRYKNRRIPKTKAFLDIKKEDLIIYYAKGKKLVGIFRIISDIDYLKNDLHWGDMAVYRIEPVSVPKNPLPFEKLIQNPKYNFDIFKNKRYWGSYLQGKMIKKLSEHDFNIFSNFIKDNP